MCEVNKMPRTPRKKSESGIYHIMMRGINRQIIFEDEEDSEKFLQVLYRYKEQCDFQVYAYCLMGNHLHLLLKVGIEPLEKIMRMICGSFVFWYNQKYDRVGNLFQDRFKSEPIETEEYLLTVIRYIHQNPVKANMVKTLEAYEWSSYRDYFKREGTGLTDTSLVLGLFHDNTKKAKEAFKEYMECDQTDNCLEMEEMRRITDFDARAMIMKMFQLSSPTDIQKFDVPTRNSMLSKIKKSGLSIRQIERLTGISRGIVQKAKCKTD